MLLAWSKFVHQGLGSRSWQRKRKHHAAWRFHEEQLEVDKLPYGNGAKHSIQHAHMRLNACGRSKAKILTFHGFDDAVEQANTNGRQQKLVQSHLGDDCCRAAEIAVSTWTRHME